jgi:hypothetical protein
MAEARRHHFVSQFYLKNFASNRADPKLFVVDLPNQESFTTSTINVGLENDFHTISTPGRPADEVEKSIAKLEAQFAPALARVVQKTTILADDEDSVLVLFFLTMLLIKNPGTRAAQNDFVNDLMNQVSKLDAADSEAWADKIRRSIEAGVLPKDTNAEEMRRLILSDAFRFGLSVDGHLYMEFANAVPLLPYVTSRGWNVLKAKAGQFVTCDRPSVLMWKDPQDRRPVGLRLRHTRLLLALSPEVAICGGFELANESFEIDEDAVAKVNGRIILNANRHVYARDSSFEYALRHNNGKLFGSDLANDEIAKDAAAPAR